MTETVATFTCPQCGGEGRKAIGYVNQAKKLGRSIYCSRKCFGLSKRSRTPEQRAEYMRKYREANRAKARRYARDYRQGERSTPREVVLGMQRQSYRRNRDENLRRMREYRSRTYPERYAAIKRWLRDNPQKADTYSAKTALARSLGIRRADVPWDMAEAKAALWEIERWLRKAIAMEAPSGGETAQTGSTVGDSAGRQASPQ